MARRKGEDRVDGHIRACGDFLEDEINPEFKGEVEVHRNMLMVGKTFSPTKSKIKIVENTNKLLNSGREIRDRKQQLEEECDEGDEEACRDLKEADCTHCDDPEELLLDLAQDDLFAECFDDAILRPPKKHHTELNFTVNEWVLDQLMQKKRKGSIK